MVGSALDHVWAAAEIDAGYVAILRAIVQPQRVAEPPATAALTHLVELSCRANGGDPRACDHVALAWNLLYTALHLLDGVEDGDLGAGPWSRWGAGAAINISTGLLATTAALLSRLEESGVSAPIAQTLRSDFCHALLGMTAGQHHDLTLSEPTLEQCWQIVTAKSGRLFALACRAGALLAGAERQQAAGCGEFGQILGVLIQIGDDLDDLWSKPGTFSDLLSGDRWRLPVAYAMTVLPIAEQQQLRVLLQAAPSEPAAEVAARSQILAAGVRLYLATESRRLSEHAHQLLCQAVPASPARDGLLGLLDTYTPFKDR